LTFLNEFSKGSGLPSIKYEPVRIKPIILALYQPFPHPGGTKRASIFKKVSFFVTQFILAKPISEPFPAECIGSELHDILNHQNIIVAFQIAIESLHKAKIIRDTGEEFILENRIEVSGHSYREIIEALSEISQSTKEIMGALSKITRSPEERHEALSIISRFTHNFKLLCVFFEQLAYKTNPHCQYPPLEL